MVGLINETIQGNYETVQQHHLDTFAGNKLQFCTNK